LNYSDFKAEISFLSDGVLRKIDEVRVDKAENKI
jgi:hypothetical protein